MAVKTLLREAIRCTLDWQMTIMYLLCCLRADIVCHHPLPNIPELIFSLAKPSLTYHKATGLHRHIST